MPGINKVVWRTNDESYADMADYNNDDEGIILAVATTFGETCWTTPLNNPDHNWRKGEEDTFDSDDAADLADCWDFRVPNRVSIRSFVRFMHDKTSYFGSGYQPGSSGAQRQGFLERGMGRYLLHCWQQGPLPNFRRKPVVHLQGRLCGHLLFLI